MQKNLLLTIFFLFFSLFSLAQSWESVKNNPIYLSGEGWGVTLRDADNNALQSLISKIAVNVSSITTQTEQETVNNNNISSNSDFKSIINTYAQATLTNTERVIIKNEPDAHVGRWIKRSEIAKIFESRKLKVNDLIESALKAETHGKADDALRCYYWALALVQSLQYPNEAVFTDDEGKRHMLTIWLPEQINGVFADLCTTIDKIVGNDIDLLITYKGKPVASVDYTYFDGRDWSNIYSAKDGRGVLELAAGNIANNYQLKYEYEYRGEAHIDKEVQSVLTSLKPIPMRNAYIYVKYDTTATYKIQQTMDQSLTNTINKTLTLTQPIIGSELYADTMDKVTKAIVTKNYNCISALFTANGLDIFHKLIAYGNARIVGTPHYNFYQNGEIVIARGVQMAFSFKSSIRKAFVEDVVFTFDNNGKISNISFGMGRTAENDILGKGIWKETARKTIMEFMENYKTAYALKRLDYIKGIFDDDAVIITGYVVKKMILNKDGDDRSSIVNSKIITYNRQTKDGYIRNLAKCFASNEFINIRFTNNDVYKLAKGGEIYAIQIAQDYYSSNYGDKGYLFLMVDINNPAQPLIKVRTWQPDKDPNFGLYGPGDF